MAGLPKSERLHGKVTISALMSKGRWGFTPHLKYCYLRRGTSDGEPTDNRMMVSVPKKLFKRAVKRNLLKRRLRESYRSVKHLLPDSGVDVMLLYNTKAILDSADVKDQVESILRRIGNERQL